MPWKETCAMKERIEFVMEKKLGKADMAVLCRKYGISRPVGYKCVNDRVKVTHRDHGIMTRPPTSLFSFKCLSPRYLEALKEKTAGSLLRYQTCQKWVTFALAKSQVVGAL